MDMQTPDHAPTRSAPTGPPSRNFIEHLLDMIAATAPAGTSDNPAARARGREAARELFEVLNPGDAADAQLAAIAVAAAQSAIDNFARAARPGMSDETVVRLRSSGLAAGRTYAMALRTLRKRQPATPQIEPAAAQPRMPMANASTDAPADAPAAAPAPAAAEVPPGFIALQPGATPIPAVETFQPRDRFGQPIPDWRTDLMTRAQVLASLTLPRDPKLEAEALAEEEAMIAEQAALDARGGKPDVEGGG
jgi:hypothetical protein